MMRPVAKVALICLAAVLLVGPALAFNLVIHPSGQSAPPPGLDSAQPDTIKYDIGGYYMLYGPTNLWGIVRFTAPSEFELRCVYIQMLNSNNVSDGVTVYIYNDNGLGQPGLVISGPYSFTGPLWLNYTWLDVDLDQPYPQFTVGEDFFVVFGPAPMGATTQGWFLYIDSNGCTEYRSGYSSSSSGPWAFELAGDLIVRAGGELAGYTDLTILNCFNDTQRYFMNSGVPVTYQAEVANVGTNDVSSYRVIWKVYNPLGFEVFADSADFGALSSGNTAIQSCPSAWTTGAPGYYLARATVWNSADPLAENNSAGLEQGIGPLGFDWYRYDDGEANSYVSAMAGFGWGNRFDPPDYPVRVDSIAVGLAGDIAISDVRVVNFVGMSVNELWTFSGPLSEGMNIIDLTAEEINIFEGGVGVAYFYQEGGSIYKDDTPPLAAPNIQMNPVAYQIYGGSWTPFEAGDWMLNAYCTESSASPPSPVIRLEPDTLNFGQVVIQVPEGSSFWVCNDGDGNLNVTDIQIPPDLQDEIFIVSTSFVVLPADSHQVNVAWVPNELGEMAGELSVVNNATDPDPVLLPIRGTAIPTGVRPVQDAQPIAYALKGNFPNPFNNSTRFAFSLPAAGSVSLKVYDIRGREIAAIVNSWLPEGTYEVTFDASALASGIYIYRLLAGEFEDSGKMLLLK